MMPSGSAVGEYIAFAASIASLFLALVAIGQTLISNQGFSESLSMLSQSADDVKAAAGVVTSATAQLSSQSDEVLLEVRSLPPAVREIAEKLDTSVRAPQADSAQAGATNQLPKRMANGLRLALFTICRSFTTGKPIDSSKLSSQAIVRNWLIGAINAVQYFGPCGITISEAGEGKFKVDSLGSYDAAALERSLYDLKEELPEGALKEIETFFATTDPPQVEAVDPEPTVAPPVEAEDNGDRSK